MKESFYLALRYLTYYKVRSTVLVLALGIIVFLPNGLKKLVEESEMQMMRRADSTPLIAGKKGSPTDLVINTLYFQQEKIETLTMDLAKRMDATGFGYSIPVFSTFKARGFPIVGTQLDYFDFRDLELVEGKMIGFVGECVIGSNVAQELALIPGDSLISSPENFFDLAGVYPLKMNVVGVLGPSDSPDDNAIFVDLKTTWIISGLGHGHQDLVEITDPTIVLQRTDSTVAAGAKLFMYNEINATNLDSFHFHGDPKEFPITSVIFVPEDEKGSTLLRGRFEAGELPDQMVVPSQVVDNLLQRIFRIKEIFNSMFAVVGVATIMILGLTVTLSLRLRKDEMFTMFTIGSSRGKIFEVVTIELMVILVLSLGLAGSLYYVTGFYVEDFINRFIL
jgi:putative ABC transport system permease protein